MGAEEWQKGLVYARAGVDASGSDGNMTYAITLGGWGDMFCANPRFTVFADGYDKKGVQLQEGIRTLDGLEERPTPAVAMERAKVWAPLRSVASWYLWRLTDGEEV